MPSADLSKLYVSDGDYTNHAEYAKCAEEAQTLWENYIKISKNIVEGEKSLMGDRANSYMGFVSLVEAAITDTLTQLLTAYAGDMKSYIEDIDTADQAMY